MQAIGFLLLCLIWGTSWVAIKVSLEAFPPFLGAALRFAVALLVLLPLAGARGLSLRVSSTQLKQLAVTGCLLYVVDYGLIYWSEQYLDAGITAILFATFPIFTGLVSQHLLKTERPRANVYAGLLIGLIGVALISEGGLSGLDTDWVKVTAGLGILVAAFSGALSSVLVKKQLSGMEPTVITVYQIVVGIFGLSAAGVWADEKIALTGGWPLAALVYLGIFASAFAFVLYYRLLRAMSAVALSTFVYFNPIVAAVFGWLVLGEVLSSRQVAGMGVVLGGVLVSQAHHYRRLFVTRP